MSKPYYQGPGAAAAEGKIYFIGGDICERYNPETNNWTTITPPPVYTVLDTVVACQNKIYMTGGPTRIYDPSTDTWVNASSLPQTLGGYQARVVNDKIYVISGEISGPLGRFDLSNATYVYDPTADS